jgi:hypothetical protein
MSFYGAKMKKRRRKQSLKRRKLRALALARAEQSHIDRTEKLMVEGTWSGEEVGCMIADGFYAMSTGTYDVSVQLAAPIKYIALTCTFEKE